MEHQELATTTTLPPEIISEILHRLPAKPLARFKCVSKSFLSLLTTRHFILRHVTHSLSTSSNLHVTRLGRSTLATLHLPTPDHNTPTPLRTIYLPFSTRAPDSDFVGSCHGLLAISDHPNFLAVVNPTTRTYHIAPVRVPKVKAESHWVDFGLGFDTLSDEYKLVRVDQRNGPGALARPREVRVYSLEECKWRKADVEFPNFLAHPKGNGKYLNNCLHWMCTTVPPKIYDLATCLNGGTGKDKTVYKYVIVGFELSSEKCCEIELPFSNGWLKKSVFPRFEAYVLEEKLAVGVEYGEYEKRVVELWLMREYRVKESWEKLFTFAYKQVRGGDVNGTFTPMIMIENGAEIEVLMEQNGTTKAVYVWFNVKSGRIRDVKVSGGELPTIFEWRGGHRCEYGGLFYVDSLIVLNNDGLVHAQPPENPAEDTNDDINTDGVLRMGSLRAHSQQVIVPRPDLGRLFVPIAGYGKRLP